MFLDFFGVVMWNSATTVFFLIVNGVGEVFVSRMGTLMLWTVDRELARTMGLSSE